MQCDLIFIFCLKFNSRAWAPPHKIFDMESQIAKQVVLIDNQKHYQPCRHHRNNVDDMCGFCVDHPIDNKPIDCVLHILASKEQVIRKKKKLRDEKKTEQTVIYATGIVSLHEFCTVYICVIVDDGMGESIIGHQTDHGVDVKRIDDSINENLNGEADIEQIVEAGPVDNFPEKACIWKNNNGSHKHRS